MRNQLILPSAAALSLVGAALGVALGNASIAEINPVHYASHEPASRFHADLTPQGYRDWAMVQASEYRAVQAGADLGAGCVGCRTYPEEVVPVHEASLGKPQTGWVEVIETSAARPAVEVVEVAEPDPAVAQVERYASFPVTAAEQEEQAQAVAEAVPYAELGWSAFD
jgi:hypothetical protein